MKTGINLSNLNTVILSVLTLWIDCSDGLFFCILISIVIIVLYYLESTDLLLEHKVFVSVSANVSEPVEPTVALMDDQVS